MNTKVNVGEDVQHLTLNQLGTIVYHIANSTNASLDYTDRYKREVLSRVSHMLCNAIEIDEESLSVGNIIQETWEDFVETFAGELYNDVDDFINDNPLSEDAMHEVWDDRVRQCVSDSEVTCHCTLTDQLKCEWGDSPRDRDTSMYHHYSQKN
jgi:hypothetical protein